MTHTGSPKRVTFDLELVEITEKATGNLVVKGIANHFTKAYEFSHFLHVSPPTDLSSHADNTSNIWHERLGHLNFKSLKLLPMIKWLNFFPPSKLPMEYVLVAW